MPKKNQPQKKITVEYNKTEQDQVKSLLLMVLNFIKVHISHPLKCFSSFLQVGLNRSQCGTQQLCVAEPSGCDPSSGSCFFLAAEQRSDQIFEFGLAGESEGYIAATLSNDATLVCQVLSFAH